ncbi:ATP-binding protein [Plebeiibacterium sediminum]|uniref:histidine kinase n=1 Tax=Plebeiibacterium sediminum TaxID=2992112 RepID=A0AAE3M2Z5_9BACT|nr:tetratricopeptide repeat-containing sensor histidine kinase [Plebeiobacterium sediminum]MCW3785877.1 tetratricopeptide repeat-containing sensor histidine kinase [Plebeiobacterium sediminum]
MLLFMCFFLLCAFKESTNKIDSLKSSLIQYIDVANDSLIFDTYCDLAYYSHDPKDRLSYATKAYDLAKEKDLYNWRALARVYQAEVYINLGDLSKAVEFLLESKYLYKQAKSKTGIATSNAKLASVYKRNHAIELAVKYYSESINILNEVKDTFRLASVYLNLGEIYRENSNRISAINCFEKSIFLYNRVKYNFGIAYAKGNIGLVYTAQNKLDSAEIYLNKSIDILEPLGDNYAVSSYLDGLAEVYFKRKQYNKAKQTAHKSLLLAQEHGLKEQIRDASLRLSTIYNQSKDFEKAFFHHKQYVAYRDSINNEETIRKIANLHTKYEVAQKQKEVDEEKAYKNRYLIIAISAISVLILLTILVFIILKISRERRKTNIILEQQRKELENANATKNKFFSILSHDLRSPLATFHSYAEVIEICSQHQDLDKLLVLGKELKSSSANLLDLLDNLLQWGVNQMGDHKSTPTTVNLKDVALMEVEHLKHVSHKKNIAVIVNIQSSVTLFVDRVQLSIALRNLLNNAIKFTPAEGSVTISAEDSKLFTTLKVTDTGVGMTQEQKETLFDFNKINSTYGTQNEKGVGLGMQLVCGFVRENNAKLHVETELGKGTTFAIVFEKK